MLCIGGFGTAVYGAGPGDSLYGMRTAIFGQQEVTRDDQVSLASAQLQQVQQLIDNGQWQEAQDKLVAVSTTVQDVGQVEQKQQLVEQWNALTYKVVEQDPAATLPPGEPLPVLPSSPLTWLPVPVDRGDDVGVHDDVGDDDHVGDHGDLAVGFVRLHRDSPTPPSDGSTSRRLLRHVGRRDPVTQFVRRQPSSAPPPPPPPCHAARCRRADDDYDDHDAAHDDDHDDDHRGAAAAQATSSLVVGGPPPSCDRRRRSPNCPHHNRGVAPSPPVVPAPASPVPVAPAPVQPTAPATSTAPVDDRPTTTTVLPPS